MHAVVSLHGREWIARPHEPGEPARHVSELSEEAGSGAPLQTVNDGDSDLLVYAYGSPPDFGADVLSDAI